VPTPFPDWILLPIGVGVGLFGTLIGAGGGFILVPLLLILEPRTPPDRITALSLAVVFFNAASGSYAYAKMKRIDYHAALWFAGATIPGAIIGALVTTYIPRSVFQMGFGALLLAGSIFLVFKPEPRPRQGEAHPDLVKVRFKWGVLLSVGVGFLSSMLGIGGGIIHVPALVHLIGFSVHTATATSHMVLAISALAGTLTNIAQGHLAGMAGQVTWASVGVIVGAQFGARLSNRVHGATIVRWLGVALALVALRVIMVR
jgi:uncharacterized membrane protein YfcA